MRMLGTLRGEPCLRRRVDPSLSGGLREWLEDALAASARSLPDGATPLFVTRRLLRDSLREGSEEGRHDGDHAALARGALVHALFRQMVTAGPLDTDAMASGLGALRVGGLGPAARIGQLPENVRRRVAEEVTSHARVMSTKLAPVPPRWLPRTHDRVAFPLAGGRIVLASRLDLVLGPPPDDRASVCVVRVRTGPRYPWDVVERRFDTLLETLRSGAPPFRTGTLYSATGELDTEDVSDDMLRSAINTVVNAVERAVAGDAAAPWTEERPTARRWTGLTARTPASLPRADGLTSALLAENDVSVTPPSVAVIESLRRRLDAAFVSLPPGRILLDGYRVARALDQGAIDSSTPFCWNARTARRRLGLAAVRVCVAGRARTPTDAITRVLDDLVETGKVARSRPGSMGSWVAKLSREERTVVEAEAVTWATRLYNALEWGRLGDTTVGPPDEWWQHRGASRVSLRGRAEVWVSPRAERGAALVSVVDGWPRPADRARLLLPVLVSALARPAGPFPRLVAGWWPDCGRALVLEVDAAALDYAAQAVVTAARLALGPARQADRPTPSASGASPAHKAA